VTTIYVTHDQVEAMTMGDRVAVLRRGALQQVDPPQRLYEDPANLFVASFIGSPEMNILEARLERIDGALVCALAGQTIAVPAETARARPELNSYVGRVIGLGIRPEQLREAGPHDAPGAGVLRGRIVATELLGSEVLAHVEVDAPPVVTQEVRDVLADVDRTLVAEVEAEARSNRSVVIGRFETGFSAHAGADVAMRLDTRRLYFFDLDSESAIGHGGPDSAAPSPILTDMPAREVDAG
jgi:multiple sugar transport system ATP-binding protein